MKTYRWGTFSVSDHLRDFAFVSEVLLYDRLVIPVPSGDDEWQRWERIGRKPGKQKDLLMRLGNRAFELPWTLERHEKWATEYYGEKVIEEKDVDKGEVRERVVEGIAFDLKNVAVEREKIREDPESAAQYITRQVIANGEDWGKNVRQIEALVKEEVDIQAFPAYGSREHFEESQGYILRPGVIPGARPLLIFEAPFLVPHGKTAAHEELLACAVELSRREEISAWRNAFYAWRTSVMERGLSPEQARQELESKREAYAAAVRAAVGKEFQTRLIWAIGIFAASAATAGAAATIASLPAVAAGAGLTSAIAGLMTAVAPKKKEVPIDPKNLGAFLHETHSMLHGE